MKAIKGFTPEMYLAWLLGQAIPFENAKELANEYQEKYNETKTKAV